VCHTFNTFRSYPSQYNHLITKFTFHLGAGEADDGGAPVAANQEPDPSPETTDDTSTGADDVTAADLEPDPVPESTSDLTVDTAAVAVDTAAVINESSDDAPTDFENRLVLRSSSVDPVGGNTRKNEHHDEDSPLIDPKTWRKIIDKSFRNNECLIHLWKNEVVPRIGITCPYKIKVLTLKDRKGIEARLKAFGRALKPYYTSKKTPEIDQVLTTLCASDRIGINKCAVLVEQYLGIIQ
jgi:hypothetical protein